ncbi:uncharacterized protein [Rutidosis leptorrhynchoides]|uniref:uncharacterized protein n=1 Tax=Rutidosis leptorrhynchoides TaxID=125765 RepID=UPI003A992C49
MYGRKAAQLLKELVSGEPGQLTGFNNDLFGQVIDECEGHNHDLTTMLSKAQVEGSSNPTTKKADHNGALIHHLSLVRNKRCLMAYVYNRAEIIQNLGWTINLPEDIAEKLSSSEKEYHKQHMKNLQTYSTALDIELGLDMVPPKDPYIKVRVLEDIGDVVLSDQVANFAKHAILFLKRTDAEQFIFEGKMEELAS